MIKKKQPSQWLTPILRPITPSTTNGKRHFGINVDLSPHPSLPVRYLWTILLLISVIYPKRQTAEKNNKHLSDGLMRSEKKINMKNFTKFCAETIRCVIPHSFRPLNQRQPENRDMYECGNCIYNSCTDNCFA